MSSPGLSVSPLMGWGERCRAILVASMMILSVYLPHGGHDEEDHVTALEGVGVIVEEGRAIDAKDFSTDGVSTSRSNSRVGARILRVSTVLIGMAFTG